MQKQQRSRTSATTSTQPRTASIAPFSGARDYDSELDDAGNGAALESPADRVSKIVDVFKGQDDEELETVAGSELEESGDEPPEGEEGQEAGAAIPKTMDELAEALGVDAADLYAIKFQPKEKGAKARTLGELKDLLAKDTDYDRREIEFDERRTSVENELLRARQDLSFMLSQLPRGSITPELEKRATTERERVARIEGERALDAIPEWADEEKRKADYAAMSGHMSEYGFRAGELERIVDHRVLKLIRDSWRRAERIKKALAATQEVKPGAPGRPAKPGQPTERRARTTAAAEPKAKVTAIGQLLLNGK